jgi:hypothetical protein
LTKIEENTEDEDKVFGVSQKDCIARNMGGTALSDLLD